MTAPQKGPLRTTAILLALVLIALALFNLGQDLMKKKNNVADLASYGEIADFTLTDSSGARFSKADLYKTKWVVNFIFTRCPSMCPTMSLQFQMLGKTLPDGVGLLSVSVDPEYDTPAVLSAYAQKYTPGIKKWHFLTGPKDLVNGLIKSCHIGTDEDPNMHSLRFILIDDKAQIRGYYDSTEPAVLSKIKEDIAKLA